MRFPAILLAAGALTAAISAKPLSVAEGCTAAHADTACVRELSREEAEALDAAVHVIARSARDECRVLAAFIRTHAHDARILPYPIRTPYGLATGDAHVVEEPDGTGRVHVADSVFTRQGALPRPMSAKVRTLVHDFAHLALTLPQFIPYLTTDAADDAISRCVEP